MAAGDDEGHDTDDEGRFEVVEMPPDTRGRRQWGVVDRAMNRWVEAGGEVDVYFLQATATQCARRLRYLTATHFGAP